MKGPYYSPGPIKNVLLGASSISMFINELRDALLGCNWTLFSNSINLGQPVYVLKSYPTAGPGNIIRVKVWYNGNTSTIYPLVRVDISDENGASEQLCGFISISSDLGNKTLRCICGPHQFFVFIDFSVSPNSNYNRAQDFNNCMGGCPHVNNGVHSQVFWGVGGNATTTFRAELRGFAFAGGLASFLINGITPAASFPDGLGNTANCYPSLLAQRSIDLHNSVPMFDGNWPVTEPLLALGRVPNKYAVVNLWDAIVVGTRFSAKTLASADLRTWESLTLSSDVEVVGCLFLVTAILTGSGAGGFSY